MAKKLTTLSNVHRTQLESEQPYLWLFEFQSADVPPQRFRLTNFTERIVYRGRIYFPAPIVHSGIQQSGEGDLPAITVTVASTTLEVATIMELNDGLVGKPAKVIIIDRNLTGNPDAGIEFRGQIQASTIDHEKIVATISAHNLFRHRFPGNVFARRKCRFLFGDARCGYDIPSGLFDRCGTKKDNTVVAPAYSFTACKAVGDDEVASGFERRHPKRFGGFPAIKPARPF